METVNYDCMNPVRRQTKHLMSNKQEIIRKFMILSEVIETLSDYFQVYGMMRQINSVLSDIWTRLYVKTIQIRSTSKQEVTSPDGCGTCDLQER